jgi:hypothetical protein
MRANQIRTHEIKFNVERVRGANATVTAAIPTAAYSVCSLTPPSALYFSKVRERTDGLGQHACDACCSSDNKNVAVQAACPPAWTGGQPP